MADTIAKIFLWVIQGCFALLGAPGWLLIEHLKGPPKTIAALSAVQDADGHPDSEQILRDIRRRAKSHEAAAALADLIATDGAGSWPPLANHDHGAWPEAVRPYRDIYFELAPLLAVEKPSLDDDVNRARIAHFRSRYRDLLAQRVDLDRVDRLLKAVDAGRRDVFPLDALNAFYCCVASSRHAYRWATIPVVRVAQLERVVDLPLELIEPWESLQRHFGCSSQSGNNTSNLVLNFDPEGNHIYKINTGLSQRIQVSEDAFSRIFVEVEVLALPIYHSLVQAVSAFARSDLHGCAAYMARINDLLSPLLRVYYTRLHDSPSSSSSFGTVAMSAWLSHVQGFFAWGAGPTPDEQYDGLSGNQAMLFIALDAFLGIEPYLTEESANRNVPLKQRIFAQKLEAASFRREVEDGDLVHTEAGMRIVREFGETVKRLRLFRATHRTRAKAYLSQPAPERLPMTAGKSLLKSDIETSLEFLDEFMVGRLRQTA